MVEITDLAESRWSDARWMVLAPHPDDETLGVGALIATAAASGHLGAVVFLTDGAGSHPYHDEASKQRLISTRKAEAEAALKRLCGGTLPHVIHLDWPDAQPYAPDGPEATATSDRLLELCQATATTAIAVTALHEPHCDHVAAAQLARAVARRGRLDVFEYLVWANTIPAYAQKAVRTAPLAPEIRRQALNAHQSQLTDTGLGSGFRLPPSMLTMADRDILYLWEGQDET